MILFFFVFIILFKIQYYLPYNSNSLKKANDSKGLKQGNCVKK